MKKEKGIAYCGLACAVCSKNTNCSGCRSEGCEDMGKCKNFACCKDKGLNGCWECNDFPCVGSMLDKLRIRSFAKFIKKYGTDFLLECLDRNERRGVIYHYPDKLTGDYDIPETEDEIIHMILHEKRFFNNIDSHSD